MICVIYASTHTNNIQAEIRYTVTDVLENIGKKDQELTVSHTPFLNNQGAVAVRVWSEKSQRYINFIWDQENGARAIDPLLVITGFNDNEKIIGTLDQHHENYIPIFSDAEKGSVLIDTTSVKKSWYPQVINNENKVLFTVEGKCFVWQEQSLARLRLPKVLKNRDLIAFDMNDHGQILFIDLKKGSTFLLEENKGSIEINKEISSSKNFCHIGLKLNNLGDILIHKISKNIFYEKDDDKPQLQKIMIYTHDSKKIEIDLEDGCFLSANMNDKREVIVNAEIKKGESYSGNAFFLWNQDEGLLDLNQMIGEEWKLKQLISINNQSQIAALAYKKSTNSLSVILLTPK